MKRAPLAVVVTMLARSSSAGKLERVQFLARLEAHGLAGAMLTSVPVRGLRPMPVLRARTLKTPNPRSSMRSPAAKACLRPSKTVSTAASALVRGRPVRSTTLMDDVLLNQWSNLAGANWIDCTTPYAPCYRFCCD
jgi:hypothetical protein